jgi:hypothetical protein
MLDSDGTVSITNSCANALDFYLSNGTLTANGLYAQVTQANVTAGSAAFTFGPDNLSDIEGSFSAQGDALTWSNIQFSGGKAGFAFPTSGQGLVMVVFNGVLPPGYTAISLTAMSSGGAGAASGMFSSTINSFC